jgi:hypothetical protein
VVPDKSHVGEEGLEGEDYLQVSRYEPQWSISTIPPNGDSRENDELRLILG